MAHDTEHETPISTQGPNKISYATQPDQKESIFGRLLNTLPKKIGATVATLALGAGGLGVAYGIGANRSSADRDPNQPSASASLVPGASESASPTSSVSIETQAPTPTASSSETTPTKMPESLAKYEKMSVTEFAALPKAEQMKYWAWLVVPNLKQYAEDYYSTSKDSKDILPVASINNTPDEIETIGAYNRRICLSHTGSDREKCLIAGLYNGKNSPAYPIFNDYYKKMPDGSVSGKALGYNKSIAILPVVSTTGNQTSPSGEVYQTIVTQKPDGSKITETEYFVTTVYDGQTVSTWESK